MKDTQKKKTTRNYCHWKLKLENVVVWQRPLIDIICLGRNPKKCPNRKKKKIYFSQNDADFKRKTSPTAAPFWPQRDLCYGITSGCFWAVVFFEKSDPIFFLFFVWVRINHVNVSLQGKRYYRYYCRSRGQGTSWSRKLSSLLSRVHLFCKFIL